MYPIQGCAIFVAFLISAVCSQYVLTDDYFAEGNFFEKFTFWDSADPTHGFVQYQMYDAAKDWLIQERPHNVRMMVDSSYTAANGRASVRLTSRTSYQLGLFVVDIDHMPGGVCGTWPAFWMVGPNWPNGGEIDIIEGVNGQQTNDMTLHTGFACSISPENTRLSGTIGSFDCTSSSEDNEGCQITTTDTHTYGSGFNAIGGGVYATEWTSAAISIFFFPRGSVPPDITAGRPNPSSWGEPVARFQGDCDMEKSFRDLRIVFDTTFCGDWAGEVWTGSTCESTTQQTCEDFVAHNAHAFEDAYWSVNALRVYRTNASSAAASSSSPLCALTDSRCSVAHRPTSGMIYTNATGTVSQSTSLTITHSTGRVSSGVPVWAIIRSREG